MNPNSLQQLLSIHPLMQHMNTGGLAANWNGGVGGFGGGLGQVIRPTWGGQVNAPGSGVAPPQGAPMQPMHMNSPMGAYPAVANHPSAISNLWHPALQSLLHFL